MQLNKVSTHNQLSNAESHTAPSNTDSGMVQAMVDAVRLRRGILKSARSLATLIAAPAPTDGFRDPRSFDDSAWRFRHRSAIAATAAAIA